MAADDTPSRRVHHRTETVVRRWAALGRGRQATVLGLRVVGGNTLLRAV